MAPLPGELPQVVAQTRLRGRPDPPPHSAHSDKGAQEKTQYSPCRASPAGQPPDGAGFRRRPGVRPFGGAPHERPQDGGRGFSPGASVLALGFCHPWGSAARAVMAKDGDPHVTPPCITGDGLCSAQPGLTDVPRVPPTSPHTHWCPRPLGPPRSLTGGSPLWSGFTKKLHLDCETSVQRPDPAVQESFLRPRVFPRGHSGDGRLGAWVGSGSPRRACPLEQRRLLAPLEVAC